MGRGADGAALRSPRSVASTAATIVVALAMALALLPGPAWAAVTEADLATQLRTLLDDERAARGVIPTVWDAELAAWTARAADRFAAGSSPEDGTWGAPADEETWWATAPFRATGGSATPTTGRVHVEMMGTAESRNVLLSPAVERYAVAVRCGTHEGKPTMFVVHAVVGDWDRHPRTDSPAEPLARDEGSTGSRCHDGGAADGQPPDGRAFDGDPSTTQHVATSDPVTAAVELSRRRFVAPSDTLGRRAAHAVLSRADTFPDSLAGASLTARGPLLLSATHQLDGRSLAELRRILPPGATVYLLGGEEALSPAVEGALADAGYRPRRLEGPTRVETALAVADEVRALHPDGGEVLLARAYGAEGNVTSGWADSVTGGTYGAARMVPLLLTPTEGVHSAVADWLSADDPTRTVLLGGEAALSDAVRRGVPRPERIWGPERSATAAEVARRLWGARASQQRSFAIINGEHPAGWAHGLAVAGAAANGGAPLLLVTGEVPTPTADLVRSCPSPQVDLLLVGGTDAFPAAVRERLEELDGEGC